MLLIPFINGDWSFIARELLLTRLMDYVGLLVKFVGLNVFIYSAV